MELKEFTKKTILDLLTAVDEVNKELGVENEDKINHKVRIDSNMRNKGRCIEFDVAVTAETNDQQAVNGKVETGIIQVLSAKLSGELSSEQKSSMVSRVQFGVNVPNKKDGDIGPYNKGKLKSK